MRIALFTSNRTTIPPEKDIVAASASLTAVLADRLVDLGHEVFLYAPEGSQTKAHLIDLGMEPLHLDFALTPEEWVKNMNSGMKQYYIGELFKDSEKYDLIHLQTEPVYLGMPFTKTTKTPVVFTNHNIFTVQEAPLLRKYKELPIVSISNFQRSIVPDLNYVSTVYNGIDVSKFPFTEESDEYMYHIGRLVKVKGIKEALLIARDTGFEFKLAGVGTDAFMAENVTPFVNEKSKYIGLVDRESNEWYQNYSRAKLLLLPIQWDEPFGLVMIEAMATGTPIVAFARGAVPEIVNDGETGFVVNPSDDDIRGDFIIKKTGIEGIKEAVQRIYSMDPQAYKEMRRKCRSRIETTFTVEKMIEGYIGVYSKLIGR